MTPDPPASAGPGSRRLRRLLRIVRVVLPVLLIALILVNIDLRDLWRLARNADPGWLVLGVLFTPSRVLSAALRWFLLLRTAFGQEARWFRTLRHYWTGVALGFFTPASAGLEVYRVVASSRDLGRPRVQVVIVVLEKVLALVGCALAALIALPFLPPPTVASGDLLQSLVWLALGLLIVGVVVALSFRRVLSSRFVTALGARAERLLRRSAPRLAAAAPQQAAVPGRLQDGLNAVIRLRPLTTALGASVAVQLSGAIGGQIMFRAVGYDIPFAVNLFVVPLLYVLFALPISVGSIGVREGGYIILYGLFGVPAEVALLVSLLNLLGLGVNSLVGSIMIWGRGRAV